MREVLKRGAFSFAISSFLGSVVNLMIDIIVNAAGGDQFSSIAPAFRELFATPVIAAYVNVLLYGVIGATFAMMTFIYEVERIGFIIQSIIYFIVTSAVCLAITMVLWQLHRYPKALICTLLCYGGTHVIMITQAYKTLKKDICEINELT